MVAKLTTSKHLRTSTELTLVAPIRSEFALTTSNDSVPMATRLGVLLATFFQLRRAAAERSLDGTAGPLERMRSLHNFCWSVFDNGQKLLLTVTFDRPWEPYIRAIVDLAGPFLDAIFCHCEGYQSCSTDQGYVAFASWVRRYQLDVSLFYSAEPDLTVDDQRYLRELERLHRESALRPRFEQRVASLALGEPGREGVLAVPAAQQAAELAASRAAADERLGRAAAALVSLREMFHAPAGDDGARRARTFFERAAWLLLEPIAGERGEGLDRLPEPVARALREMRAVSEAACREARDARERALPPAEAERERLGREVQANILSPYARMTIGCAALLGFDGAAAARAFIARMATEVTAHADAASPGTKVNVALTLQGLRTLGLSEAELALFPLEFREGMAARAGLLGDVGPEHPDNWGGPRRGGLDADPRAPLASLAEVDLLLVLQSQGAPCDWGPAHPLYSRLRNLLADVRGVRVINVLPLQRELAAHAPEGAVKERFGYVDGVSQPVPAPWAREEPGRDRVALGELLLGHGGDRGDSERYPAGPESYARDGSFLVVRQLEQDVEAFEAFIEENAGAFAGGREALYTKLMGRQRDGRSPITPGSIGNDFDYSNDAAGERCPLASHVRRTNPRTPPAESVHGLALRGPRIARRGFSYGPFSGRAELGPRGLLFMAYNASLAEQFEVVQRWINGANSTGVLSAHADPVVSHRSGQVITLLDGREPRYLLKKKPFVKLVWGAYFFAPSKPALHALSRLDAARAERERVEQARLARGEQTARQLAALAASDEKRATFAWKRLLEDRIAPDAREGARAVWAFIRALPGGVLRTPYGVLVGTAEHVRRVLGDEVHFSVHEYGRRMQRSVGLLYLGLDRCPVAGHDAGAAARPNAVRYRDAAELPNAFMAGLSREAAMLEALASARRHFERLGPYVELAELAKQVVSDVSRQWFGLPRSRQGYDIHHTAALSIFYPNPEGAVHGAAETLAAGLEAAKAAALQDEPPLARFLREGGFEGDIGQALVGAAQGTLAATVGSFLSVAVHCLENERLGRLGAWLASGDGQDWQSDPSVRARAGDDAPIVREVLGALCEQPAPDLLHRTVVAETELGGLPLAVGERVVVSLASAIASGLPEPERAALLFGGPYPSEGAAPKHPCPGREAALGVVLALLLVLLENDVRRDGGLRVSRRA